MGIGNIANSGMSAAISGMEVISNNIANANTYGFKKATAYYADLYPTGSSSTTPGTGVELSNVLQDFSTGGPEVTGGDFDLVIGSTNSFFILSNSISGQTTYTRNGQFTLADTGYVGIEGTNLRLQAYPATDGVILGSAVPSDLFISEADSAAKATTTVTENVNLDANDSVISASFSASDDTTYSYRSDTDVYDSLGDSYTLTLYYIKKAANTWLVEAQVNGTSAGTGTITFTSAGVVDTVSGLSALSFDPTSGAASPQALDVKMTGSTQYAGASANNGITQDGYAAGVYTGYSLDDSGNVTVSYSNGQSTLIGQVALANFNSPTGLKDIGSMSWVATSASGNPIISQANSDSNITVGSLELSNVDLTEEMVNLIGAQNTFQANAQVEQVFNQIMQTITKL